ncbi:hypothetical protein HQO90_02130 [Rhodococcus fascians]|nr:hypothetical protein [Rhodococcus fascians]
MDEVTDPSIPIAAVLRRQGLRSTVVEALLIGGVHRRSGDVVHSLALQAASGSDSGSVR